MLALLFAFMLVVGLAALLLDKETRSRFNGWGSKKCYSESDSARKMYCSKVVDSAFFPIEAEDYADAYQVAKRYGS